MAARPASATVPWRPGRPANRGRTSSADGVAVVLVLVVLGAGAGRGDAAHTVSQSGGSGALPQRQSADGVAVVLVLVVLGAGAGRGTRLTRCLNQADQERFPSVSRRLGG